MATSVSRRRFLQTSALGLGGLAAGSQFLTVTSARAAEAEINMQLGWLAARNAANHAPPGPSMSQASARRSSDKKTSRKTPSASIAPV